MKKYFQVSRKTLLLFAGLLWVIAGFNVLMIGINTWQAINKPSFLVKSLWAMLVFCTFLFMIFKPLHKKYTLRIANLNERNHPLIFFNLKGWGIMFFMITLGVTVRKFNLLPDSFIASFYTGLSLALSTTGFLFLYSWLKRNKNS